jgi:hypothetical protein
MRNKCGRVELPSEAAVPWAFRRSKGHEDMLPTGKDAGPKGSGNPQRDIDINSTRDPARRLTAMPESKRSAERKKVLDRARRMLAAALEEERMQAKREIASQASRAAERRPGCGAWWLF